MAPSILAACFGCAGGSLVPPDHIELSRAELKALYEKSLSLNNGRLIVHGIFARADTKNNNKRVYPKNILKREVAKFEQQHISRGTALGELDHPNYASHYFKCLNLPNVSHQVLEVHWKGDQLWGTIEVLPTPSGMLLWELYSQGIKLGVSSRGWASLRTDPKAKCVYVDDDFELITFDFVTEPSTRGAYLVPIRKPYRPAVPDQSKAVQVARLGHGVVGMAHVGRLPELPLLVGRINELHAAQVAEEMYVAQAAAGLRPPAPVSGGPGVPGVPGAALTGLRPHGLDQLLRFSHYVVFPHAVYLDREAHARDFSSHLAMFATRAHLADQQQFLNRSDLNAIILREIAREEEAELAMINVAGSLPGAGHGQSGRHSGPMPMGLPPPHPNTAHLQGHHMYNAGSGKLAGDVGSGNGVELAVIAGAGGVVKGVPSGHLSGGLGSSGSSGSASLRSSQNGALPGPAAYMHGSVSIGNLNNSGASAMSSTDPSTVPTPTQGGGMAALGSMRSSVEAAGVAPSADVSEAQGPPGNVRSHRGADGLGASDLGAWALHPNALDIPSGGTLTLTQEGAGPPGVVGSSDRSSANAQRAGSDERSSQYSYASPPKPTTPQQLAGTLGTSGQGVDYTQQQHQAPITPGGFTHGPPQGPGHASLAPAPPPPPMLHHHNSGNRVSPAPPEQYAGSAGSGTGAPGRAGGAAAGPQGSVSERVVDEVAAEFQRIKLTLASFASKYNSQQDAIMRALSVQLPLPSGGAGAMSGLGLTGARL